MDSDQVVFRVPRDVYDALAAFAAANDLTKSQVVRSAARQYLADVGAGGS